MMNWEKSEKKAFEWFKNNYDNDAVYQGHNNSTISDIYSPLYNCYIEVKDITNSARCGQFTKSTISNNPYADRKSTRLNSSHVRTSRMPSSA